MRCIHTHKAPIRLHTSPLHYSTIIALIFLTSSIIFYVHSIFGALPAAFSKGTIVPVQINGPAQPPGFSPAFLTLHVDETVMFINHAFPAGSYTLKADDGSFSSPAIPAGGQWAITFHTIGSHTYRDTSATSTMIGELLVVDKSVPLLATPDPLVEATVIALIKNGHNPPGTIIIATHKHLATSSSGSFIPLIILVMGISVGITLLGVLGITYYRRYRQRAAIPDEDRTEPEDDADNSEHIQQIRNIIDNMKKKLQTYPPFKAHESDDDDDDDD